MNTILKAIKGNRKSAAELHHDAFEAWYKVVDVEAIQRAYNEVPEADRAKYVEECKRAIIGNRGEAYDECADEVFTWSYEYERSVDTVLEVFFDNVKCNEYTYDERGLNKYGHTRPGRAVEEAHGQMWLIDDVKKACVNVDACFAEYWHNEGPWLNDFLHTAAKVNERFDCRGQGITFMRYLIDKLEDEIIRYEEVEDAMSEDEDEDQL